MCNIYLASGYGVPVRKDISGRCGFDPDRPIFEVRINCYLREVYHGKVKRQGQEGKEKTEKNQAPQSRADFVSN